MPGRSSPVRFHWMMRSAISMCAARCSSVALRWSRSLTVMFRSMEKSLSFHSS